MNYNYNKGGVGKVLSVGNDIQYKRYVSEIAKYKPLSREEEKSLFEEYSKTGNELILEKICKHNLLFVLTVARHYAISITSSQTLVLEDLINEGNLGLCIAAKKFDYTTDNKFISYAVWWIRQHILKCIQDNIKNIRIPTSARSEVVKVNKKQLKMEQELGHDVSFLEVFEKMLEDGEIQIDKLNDIDNAIKMHQFEKSLNRQMNDDDGTEIIELLSDDNTPSADEMVIDDERKKFLYRIVGRMNPKVINYVCDYFGLLDNNPLSYSELSKKYNVPRDTIRVAITKELKLARLRNQDHVLEY